MFCIYAKLDITALPPRYIRLWTEYIVHKRIRYDICPRSRSEYITCPIGAMCADGAHIAHRRCISLALRANIAADCPLEQSAFERFFIIQENRRRGRSRRCRVRSSPSDRRERRSRWLSLFIVPKTSIILRLTSSDNNAGLSAIFILPRCWWRFSRWCFFKDRFLHSIT